MNWIRTLGLAVLLGLVLVPATPVRADDAEVTRETIIEWVEKLGDSSYEVREKAMRRLIEIGPSVLPHIEKALESDDPEIRWRAERIKAELRNATEEKTEKKKKRSLPRHRLRRLEPQDLNRLLEKLLKSFDENEGFDFDWRIGPDGKDKKKKKKRGPFGFGGLDEGLKKMMDDMRKRVEKQLKEGFDSPRKDEGFRVYRWKDGRWELDEKSEQESSSGPRFGLTVSPASPALCTQLGLESGLVVEAVKPGSPAQKAGLKDHDVLLLESVDELNRLLQEKGTKSVPVLRGGKRVELSIDWTVPDKTEKRSKEKKTEEKEERGF